MISRIRCLLVSLITSSQELDECSASELEELDSTIEFIESVTHIKAVRGYNPNVRLIRFTMDPLNTIHRPLVLYAGLAVVARTAGALLLRSLGFVQHRGPFFSYWHRPGKSADVEARRQRLREGATASSSSFYSNEHAYVSDGTATAAVAPPLAATAAASARCTCPPLSLTNPKSTSASSSSSSSSSSSLLAPPAPAAIGIPPAPSPTFSLYGHVPTPSSSHGRATSQQLDEQGNDIHCPLHGKASKASSASSPSSSSSQPPLLHHQRSSSEYLGHGHPYAPRSGAEIAAVRPSAQEGLSFAQRVEVRWTNGRTNGCLACIVG